MMAVEKGYRLEWKGTQCQTQVVRAIIGGLHEWDLEIETAAKRILQPGQGVVTGTLRRSIHAANPIWRWEWDDVEPSRGTPERSGQGGEPIVQGHDIVGTIGSGLSYALPVHDGHGSFPGYHYIISALVEVEHKLPEILEKHARRQDLT